MLLANKLSLNLKKTKYSLFHRKIETENLPLRLPTLKIDEFEIKRESSMKFLGVILDENLTWSQHLRMVENKISKNLGILYKTRAFIGIKNLKDLYHSFIHSYINYANSSWASTNAMSMKRIFNIQKHACRVILKAERRSPSKPLFEKLKFLSVYQINVYQILQFMHTAKLQKIPRCFSSFFKKDSHKYNTRHSRENYKVPKRTLKQTSYRIGFRGPYIWNKFLNSEEKRIMSFPSFKKVTKIKLLQQSLEMKG